MNPEAETVPNALVSVQTSPTQHDALGVLVGLDLGMSLTKIAHQTGSRGRPVLERFVSKARPLKTMPSRANGSHDLLGGREVLVGDEVWVAGIQSPFHSRHTRSRRRAHTDTQDWTALAHAALASIGQMRVQHLVAGVPISEFYKKGRADALKASLQGKHQVSVDQSVEVQRVSIIPRPLGAFAAWVSQYEAACSKQLDRDASVLVIDAGHSEVAWMQMQGPFIRRQSSGYSLQGGLDLLRRVSETMDSRFRHRVSMDRLEARFQQNEMRMDLGEVTVDLYEQVLAVADLVVSEVILKAKKSQRPRREGLLAILLTGGWRGVYEPAVAAAFPETNIIRLADPISANAIGCLQFARHLQGCGTSAL